MRVSIHQRVGYLVRFLLIVSRAQRQLKGVRIRLADLQRPTPGTCRSSAFTCSNIGTISFRANPVAGGTRSDNGLRPLVPLSSASKALGKASRPNCLPLSPRCLSDRTAGAYGLTPGLPPSAVSARNYGPFDALLRQHNQPSPPPPVTSASADEGTPTRVQRAAQMALTTPAFFTGSGLELAMSLLDPSAWPGGFDRGPGRHAQRAPPPDARRLDEAGRAGLAVRVDL